MLMGFGSLVEWSRHSLRRCRDVFAIIGGSCYKYNFCRDKGFVFCRDESIFVATKIYLSRQKYVCRDKTFVTTSILLSDKHVNTKRLLSRQKYACREKSFVVTNTCLSREIFAATKLRLSRQAYFCRDKSRVLS